MNHHGRKLQRILRTHDITQAELAEAAGVARSAVFAWAQKDTFDPHVFADVKRGLLALQAKGRLPQNSAPAPEAPPRRARRPASAGKAKGKVPKPAGGTARRSQAMMR